VKNGILIAKAINKTAISRYGSFILKNLNKAISNFAGANFVNLAEY
jgi:hypothetical protein